MRPRGVDHRPSWVLAAEMVLALVGMTALMYAIALVGSWLR